ncbi:MAG: signal peptide peptidase SppA [Acidobacteriota bacterium]
MTRRNGLLILGVLAGSLLLVVVGLGILFSADGVPDHAVLRLTLRDTFPETGGNGFLDRLLGWRTPTVLDVVTALDAASDDGRVPAVLLRVPGRVCCGLERFQEARQAIHRYQAAGGHVTAVLEGGWLPEYYLASAADEVILLPGQSLDLTGLVMMVPFLRGTLDLVGVTPQFETTGEHKDAPQIYTDREMRPSMRAELARLMNALRDEIVAGVAADRGLEPGAVQAWIDRGTLGGAAAVDAGLVDAVAHADEARDRLEKSAGTSLTDLDLFDYLGSLRPGWFARPHRIGLVYLSGVILPGESSDSEWYDKVAGADTLTRALEAVRDDDDIAAVVLRIDSPGGSSAASEKIWRAVTRTRQAKPVIVSVGNYAASGGYYVAVGASDLVALPMSLTGSIGVYAGKFSMTRLYDWLGLRWGIVKGSENADLYLDVEPWTDDQLSIVRDQVGRIFDRFQDVVSTGRGIDRETLAPLATGQVWTGNDAVRLSLVDRIGGLHEAIALARERAGLPPDPRVHVQIFPRPRGLLARFSGSSGVGALGPRTALSARDVRQLLILDRLSRAGVMAYWPVRLDAR